MSAQVPGMEGIPSPINDAAIVFPHQLFFENPVIMRGRPVLIVEDPLFFGDRRYPARFHKQKIVLHRSTLKHYQSKLLKEGHQVIYLEAQALKDGEKAYERLFQHLQLKALHVVDPVDYMVEKRLRKASKAFGVQVIMHESPSFLNTKRWISAHYSGKTHFTLSSFYILQRKRLGILVDGSKKPIGGKWSFEAANSKKNHRGMAAPAVHTFKRSVVEAEAIHYADTAFMENHGYAEDFWFPTTHEQAHIWLKGFIEKRLVYFADYQEALIQKDVFFMHSVLAQSLNIGLLTPQEVLDSVMEYHEKQPVPLNSLEAFIRQLAGWREFARTVYVIAGVRQRKSNYWKHRRHITSAFYEGTTGIYPIDLSIKKLSQTAYAHHNERLRLLGAFMMLCEVHPDDVYRWFMEMFIDSYDWVVVPNVYWLSQFADGGRTTSIPCMVNSRYLLKMSDYPKGEWCAVWDALYWRFLSIHEAYFEGMPRFKQAMGQMRRMGKAKLSNQCLIANRFLEKLFGKG